MTVAINDTSPNTADPVSRTITAVLTSPSAATTGVPRTRYTVLYTTARLSSGASRYRSDAAISGSGARGRCNTIRTAERTA